MNAIKHAVNYVKHNIPKPILNYGLRDAEDNKLISLDSLITNKIVREIVMIRMDLYGSNKLLIPVRDCELLYQGSDGITFHIPKELTNNRSIVIATEVVSGDPDGYGNEITIGTPLGSNGLSCSGDMSGSMADLNKLTRTLSPMNTHANNVLTIIGENTIHIDGPVDRSSGMFSVIIENDASLNNIGTRYYPVVNELVLLATKAYIYNERILSLGEGYIEHGHSHDKFTSIIEGWDTASEEFEDTFNKKWTVTVFMNDRPRKSRLIRGMIGTNT